MAAVWPFRTRSRIKNSTNNDNQNCYIYTFNIYKSMPRRRDKRSDTENSDDYEDQQLADRVTHFGTVQINRLLAPDQIEGDDASKYSILAWSNTLNAQRLLPWTERKDLFERAVRYLPYSYKIWHMYLREFMEYCSTRLIISK